MPGFTTRTLKARPPEPKDITAAAEQADIARQALLKMAHHLDDLPTRHMHRNTLLTKERVDRLSIELTEWVG